VVLSPSLISSLDREGSAKDSHHARQMGSKHRFKCAYPLRWTRTRTRRWSCGAFFDNFRKARLLTSTINGLRGTITTEGLFAQHPVQAAHARTEAWLAELGKVPTKELHERIRQALGGSSQWVLCGGPPCQAYSIVGRSRRGGIDDDDKRLYLYREYLRILAEHEPSVFIMENVKGLLSSRVAGSGLFAQILADLHAPGASVGHKRSTAQYRVLSLVQAPQRFDSTGNPQFDPQEFVIRSEQYGVPQTRHRVILLGVREDLWQRGAAILTPASREVPVSQSCTACRNYAVDSLARRTPGRVASDATRSNKFRPAQDPSQRSLCRRATHGDRRA